MRRRGYGKGGRRCDSGQATVEYLIVGLVVMIIVSALAQLVVKTTDGTFQRHASQSASHVMGGDVGGTVGDIILY